MNEPTRTTARAAAADDDDDAAGSSGSRGGQSRTRTIDQKARIIRGRRRHHCTSTDIGVRSDLSEKQESLFLMR